MTDTIRDFLAAALGPGFTIGRELGGGGMSRVWVARDESLGREVVVKLLSPDLAQDLLAYNTALIRTLATMPDSGGIALQLAQNFAARPLPRLATDADSVAFRDAMSLTYAGRGRGHEALKWSKAPVLEFQLARAGIVPIDSVLARARKSLSLDPRQAVGVTRLFAETRDSTSLRRLASWADSIDDAARLANGRTTPSATAALPGFLALATGDTTAALRTFLSIPMTACNNVPCAASTVATLLMKRGRPADAARVLDRWLPSATARTDVPLDWLMRARIAEQMGDAGTAALFYRRVATVWKGGDAELQGTVAEANAGARRVSRR